MNRADILRMAEDLEKAAKNEEVFYIKFFDLNGKVKTVHRYALPYVAEGLRKQALAMVE